MATVQEIREKFMSKYHITDEIFYKHTINTGDKAGPTYISANPDHQSVVKPIYVTVQSIDDFKEFGGIADSLYDNNTMVNDHPTLPEWDAAKTDLPYSELSPKEKADICQAYTTYIYGYSKKVQSYKEVIHKHYFPVQLPIFSAQDVIVTPGSPLVLSSDGDKPVVFNFHTVTIEPGGKIINEGNSTILVDKLIQETSKELANAQQSDLTNVGANGQDGTDGQDGGKGYQGSTGSPGSDGKHSCSTEAGQGGTGGNGKPGEPGNNGMRGGDSGILHVTVDIVEGPVTLMSYGGNGGNGGKGGNGGQGGNGGDGGYSTSHCSAGPQGRGGNGGQGGNGGNGGEAGNGGNLYYTYNQLGPNGSVSLGPPTKGTGGKGGMGGRGGDGGKGNPYGASGMSGSSGQSGNSGKIGTIYINGVRQN